jgi:folate-binding protein YgfZ
MAVDAPSLHHDHEVLTTACGLVGRSPDGKLALTGGEAAGLLSGQLTNDIEALVPGTGCYAALLTNKGKMLADLRVVRTDDELLLLTERPTLQVLFDTLRRASVGWDAELHKRTLEQELVSLIGPRAREVAGADAVGLAEDEHANRAAQIAGRDVLLIATDTGVDVLGAAGDAAAVRAALLEAGAREVAPEAAEIVRVEQGRPRYGIDLDESVIPQEAGLNERAVSFTKGCYVGQETVARLFYKGRPNRHLRGLRLGGSAEPGEVVRVEERELGRLGSVVASPAHGWIALALLRREAEPGDEVAVGDGGTTATVVELPF